MLIRSAGLVALLFLLHSTGMAQLLSHDPAKPTGDEAQSELRRFSPTLDLASARFVVAHSGHLFVELSNNQSLLQSRYPSLRDFSPVDASWERSLSRKMQRMLFRQIPESKGDPYTIFTPSSGTFTQRSLKGLALRFVGADSWQGLWGILGRADMVSDNWEIAGLAFPGRYAERAVIESLAPQVALGENDAADVLKTILKATGESNVTLIRVEPLQIQYGKKPGAAAIVQDKDGNQSLFCLVRDAESWSVAPFGPSEANLVYATPADGGGIAFLEPNAEAGYAFVDSKLFVLPDMDGDGNAELMLHSTAITVLFAVRTEDSGTAQSCFVREIRGISFAS